MIQSTRGMKRRRKSEEEEESQEEDAPSAWPPFQKISCLIQWGHGEAVSLNCLWGSGEMRKEEALFQGSRPLLVNVGIGIFLHF